ncbi:MAG: MacB family efflux pump subunit [Sulfurovaceae bacterium]|nr:MacB family efflux pump subunit [Sulfurovaceae bacterium]MDD5548991.1 MacB family efflux pump subunit [Sulfurovaceae bacterium]
MLEVKNLYKRFLLGDNEVEILKNINLTINRGEFVAIIGQSGSGKTTLMNILGCLDTPSAGEYKIDGKLTADMDSDDLAKLRREHFGFIFQKYHLLSDLDALSNVEIPSIYANYPQNERIKRANELLNRLGLAERLHNRPNQLSGGQQQRVSIARALMNGGEIIFADEPTGALDSKSGEEVMNIIRELNELGHTIILVTHEPTIAAMASRIIEIKDGEIISDNTKSNSTNPKKLQKSISSELNSISAMVGRFKEAFSMALNAMFHHKLRTFLTMLGIIIGIASVVSVVALGEGSKQKILKDISSMGTNTLNIYRGYGFGDTRSAKVRTLTVSDMYALSDLPFVDSVTPIVNNTANTSFENKSVTAKIKGVGEQFFQVKGIELDSGALLDRNMIDGYTQDGVIDQNAKKELFGENSNPIGKIIIVDNMPIRVIGVTKKLSSMMGEDDSVNIWIPYTTVMGKMLGQSYLTSFTVRLKDNVDSTASEEAISKVLEARHGDKDFTIANLDSIRQTIESTTGTMRLLIAMIAAISLIVGGIGVMNIMLVSVTERTSEIGVRMAVGARESDIMQQFLIESVLVCVIGGVLGISLALGIGQIFGSMSSMFSMIFSSTSIVFAFACSTAIGVIFGFVPAKNAAKLNPVVALNKE